MAWDYEYFVSLLLWRSARGLCELCRLPFDSMSWTSLLSYYPRIKKSFGHQSIVRISLPSFALGGGEISKRHYTPTAKIDGREAFDYDHQLATVAQDLRKSIWTIRNVSCIAILREVGDYCKVFAVSPDYEITHLYESMVIDEILNGFVVKNFLIDDAAP